jgi:hypothetical protein
MVPGLAADQLFGAAVRVRGGKRAPIDGKLDGQRRQLGAPGEVAAAKAARDLVVGGGHRIQPTGGRGLVLVISLARNVGLLGLQAIN